MSDRMHLVVVCYDIPDNKRRSRLFRKLHRFGSPVQYNVFECLVDDKEQQELKGTVARIIRKTLDHVRYYHLCATCQGRIETTRAGKEVTKDEPSYTV